MAKRKSNELHPAEQYAEDVRSGKIVACHWVKMAVERYYRDLDNAIEKGWVFSRQAAERAINFCHKLKHVKGSQWAGKHIQLEPWQQFIIWNLFGFLMADTGYRRFREAYVSVAKKNGKTTLAAPLSLYMGIADKEMGAEVYYVAAVRYQARICFDMAKLMVQRSDLAQMCVTTRDAISYERMGATFQPLSTEGQNTDGKSSHFVVLDEYHAHPTDEAYDLMQNSLVARAQGMLFVITTAGRRLAYPCHAYEQTMRKVLDGAIEADRNFAIIYTLDDVSEVHDSANWVKANPCLGTTLEESILREQYKQMINDPRKESNILTKHFNMWVDAPEVWIPDATWSGIKSVVPADSLEGCSCIGALDLAAVNDYCAFSLMFQERGRYQFLWRFYIPEDKYTQRYESHRENASIEAWVRNGYVMVTPGNAVDYDYIIADIANLSEKYDIKVIAYDPWNSSSIVPRLVEMGAHMEPFTQTIGNFALPTKEFERIVALGIVDHYDNPVARWMLSNVVVKEDVNGNKRPDKSKSADKIDGIVAAIMALGQSLSDKADNTSVYAKRGIVGSDDIPDDDLDNEFNLDDDDYLFD